MQVFEQRIPLFFSNQEAGITYNVSGQMCSNNSSNFEYSWLVITWIILMVKKKKKKRESTSEQFCKLKEQENSLRRNYMPCYNSELPELQFSVL